MIQDKWDKEAIPLDIIQEMEKPDNWNENDDEKLVSEDKSKPISLLKKPTKQHDSIWDAIDHESTSDEDVVKPGFLDFESASIDPNSIRFKDSSIKIAKESVAYYLNQIQIDTQNFKGENRHYVDKMYDDAKKLLWCLNGFPLMWYFIRVALHSLAAAGQNTPAERGMKKVKWWATAEKNRLKGKSINILNTLHENVIAQELDYQLKHGETSTAEDCVELMKLMGYHTSQEERFNKLCEEISQRKKKLYDPRMFN